MSDNIKVDATAVIDVGAHIGAGSAIWHFCHVSAGARLGENCRLGQNVFVANDVVIGNNVKIQNNVSLYDKVVLEDDVFCGPSVVFTNVINPRAAVVRKHCYLPTLVKRGATLGANSTLVCGITIGEYAFIGAGAVVTQSVPAYALMLGVPAKQVGWMSQYGHRLALPLQGQGQCQCPESGQQYQLTDNSVQRIQPVENA